MGCGCCPILPMLGLLRGFGVRAGRQLVLFAVSALVTVRLARAWQQALLISFAMQEYWQWGIQKVLPVGAPKRPAELAMRIIILDLAALLCVTAGHGHRAALTRERGSRRPCRPNPAGACRRSGRRGYGLLCVRVSTLMSNVMLCGFPGQERHRAPRAQRCMAHANLRLHTHDTNKHHIMLTRVNKALMHF
jgi:hypothetical protein